MRFLRMLSNCAIAGALGAAYLTVLVLQLNPHVPLVSATTWQWFVTLAVLYGLHLAVFLYVLLVAREFFSMEGLSPGWASVSLLAWLSAVLAAGIAVLMWLNVRRFDMTLTDVAVRRMMAGSLATTVCAVVLLGIALVHYSSGRRGSRVGAALLVIALIGSVSLPLAARGPAVAPPAAASWPARAVEPQPGPRVVMLLLDGASLEHLWPVVAEGRLPNFSRLLKEGAAINLATVRPASPGAVWTAAATGVYPWRTGIRSGAFYFALGDAGRIDLLPAYCFSHALVQLGLVRRELPSTIDVRVRPLWSILAEAGVTAGVVRLPLTYPAPDIAGFVVSDRLHEAPGSMDELDEQLVSPPDWLAPAREAFVAAPPDRAPGAVRPADAAGRAAGAGVGEAGVAPEDAASFARDRGYARVLRGLATTSPPRFVALRYLGLDAAGHRYTGDMRPGAFGGPTDARRRAEQALSRYYDYIDSEIGGFLADMEAGDLLLVVSGFGMQRLSLVKRLAARLLGGETLTGTHERAPDGFLLAYGDTVQPGRQQRGSIVDVTPTVLYYLGLPVGRDMDGFARSDLFTTAFTAERPIAFIPTYNR
jgi:hypothetical protein